MFEIETEQVPIKLWLRTIDDGALAQARNIANLPYTFHHVALMPDTHQGFGMPIGAVLATREVVIPNAVGVDIGCGMNAIPTSLEEIPRQVLTRIIGELRSLIPTGFKHYEKKQPWEGFARAPETEVVRRELDAARYQLGTLGGGNHFIELQRGSDGRIWIMLHSGSRNFGYTIAREYYQIARADAVAHGLVLPDIQLAPLFLGTREAEEYLAAMTFAQEFAAASRRLMLERTMEAVEREFPAVEFGEEVNIHHNFAAMEEHFGQRVVVHRKGATSARTEEVGIIPGSQGTCSYIVEGLGNPASFYSCSHGAGRVMGRREARRRLDLHKEQKKLEEQGILHALHSPRDLDEAASAYKDIDEVMELQRDLVNVRVKLTPLAVIKG